MNEQQPSNLSRRQLLSGFRARKPATMGQGGEGIQPTEPLTPRPGLSVDDLPPVHQATLDAAQIQALFYDLSRHATDVRLSSHSFAAIASSQVLNKAATSLVDGTTNRLQIRYNWQDKAWIDTLNRTPEGFRLVRIAHAI